MSSISPTFPISTTYTNNLRYTVTLVPPHTSWQSEFTWSNLDTQDTIISAKNITSGTFNLVGGNVEYLVNTIFVRFYIGSSTIADKTISNTNAPIYVDTIAPVAPTTNPVLTSALTTKNNVISVVLGFGASTWSYKTTAAGTVYNAGVGTSFTLTDGTYAVGAISVKNTDAALNESVISNTAVITIDTIAPGAPTTNPVLTSALTTDNNVISVVLGTGASTWSYKTIAAGTVYTQGSGTSFTLTDGQYAVGAISVKNTDAALNESVISNAAVITIDSRLVIYSYYDAVNSININFTTVGSTATITGYTADPGITNFNLNIPSPIFDTTTPTTTYTVTSIGANAFDRYVDPPTPASQLLFDYMRILTFPSSVTYIGINAFRYNQSMTCDFSNTSIGFISISAFNGCLHLTDTTNGILTLPSVGLTLAEYAFIGCNIRDLIIKNVSADQGEILIGTAVFAANRLMNIWIYPRLTVRFSGSSVFSSKVVPDSSHTYFIVPTSNFNLNFGLFQNNISLTVFFASTELPFIPIGAFSNSTNPRDQFLNFYYLENTNLTNLTNAYPTSARTELIMISSYNFYVKDTNISPILLNYQELDFEIVFVYAQASFNSSTEITVTNGSLSLMTSIDSGITYKGIFTQNSIANLDIRTNKYAVRDTIFGWAQSPTPLIITGGGYFFFNKKIDFAIIKNQTYNNADPTNTSIEFDISSYYRSFLPVGYRSENYSLKKLNASNPNFKMGYSVGNIDVCDIYTTYYEDYTNTDVIDIYLTGDKRKFTKAAFVLIGGGGKGGAGGELPGGGGASGAVIITKLIDITSYERLQIRAGTGGTTAGVAMGGEVSFYDAVVVGAKLVIRANGGGDGIGSTGGSNISSFYCLLNGVEYDLSHNALNDIINFYRAANRGATGISGGLGGIGASISKGYSSYTPELPSTSPVGNGSTGSGYGVGGNGAASGTGIPGGNGTPGFVRIYWYAI